MKVTFAVTQTQINLPDGVTAGILRTELLNADGAVEASIDDGDTFNGVSAGQKTLRLSRLDSTGAVIGSPFTKDFEVSQVPPTEPTQVGIPTGVTITVSADDPALAA